MEYTYSFDFVASRTPRGLPRLTKHWNLAMGPNVSTSYAQLASFPKVVVLSGNLFDKNILKLIYHNIWQCRDIGFLFTILKPVSFQSVGELLNIFMYVGR